MDKLPRRIGSRTRDALFFAVLAASQGLAPAYARPSPEQAQPPRSSPTHDARIAAWISQELRHSLDRQPRSPGQAATIEVAARFEQLDGERTLTVDLGPGFVPPGTRYLGADLEDSLKSLRTTIDELLRDPRGDMPVRSIRFLYQGKTMEHAFPGERT